jgi:hypothetical protein
VPFGSWRFGIEANAVITDHHLDFVTMLLNRDPDVPSHGVLESIHDRLAGIVVQQEGNRRWQVHFRDLGVKPNIRVAADLGEEPLDRFG